MFHEPELNNEHYDDCYFSYDDGYAEAIYVFVEGNHIVERCATQEKIIIAETGFGTGLNLLATMQALREAGLKNKTIRFLTVEKFTLSPDRIKKLIALFSEEIKDVFPIFIEAWKNCFENLSEGWNNFSFTVDSITAEVELFVGDVIPFLESLPTEPDGWYLDGHSPSKNPDMWNETVLGLVGTKSGKHSTVSTFSAAGVVKRGLRDGGFFIKRQKGFGGKRHMIVGWFEQEDSQL